jgi:[LSU ribosomal protein L11P]-lysine N-methyltransferase (EC 2.1.1.-)
MFELRLLCPEANVEMVSEALEALDALSVSVEDADAQTASEQPLFGEPGMPAPGRLAALPVDGAVHDAGGR